MVAEHAVHQHRVARPGEIRTEFDPGADNADAGGGQEQFVAGAALYHLGVAGHHQHAGLVRRRRHRSCDPVQQIERQALLDDGGARQVERHRSADGQVVDRAAHRKLADIAARKLQRIDHEGVGGHRQSVAVFRQQRYRHARLVIEWRQQRVVECGDEDLIDQVLHRLATATVAEGDCLHAAFAA